MATWINKTGNNVLHNVVNKIPSLFSAVNKAYLWPVYKTDFSKTQTVTLYKVGFVICQYTKKKKSND